jgi:hypothetical protein
LKSKSTKRRRLAKRLAKESKAPKKDGVLAAFLRAPSIIADVDFDRPIMRLRKVDL